MSYPLSYVLGNKKWNETQWQLLIDMGANLPILNSATQHTPKSKQESIIELVNLSYTINLQDKTLQWQPK